MPPPFVRATKEVVAALERADILQDDPIHPDLETAAIAMARSLWWCMIPKETGYRGRIVGPAFPGTHWRLRTTAETNEVHGEIPWH